MRSTRRVVIAVIAMAAGLSACQPLPLQATPSPAATAPAMASTAARRPEVLLLGEQHDQPDQQRQIAAELAALIARHRLQALVLEMVDDGHDSRALASDASEAAVREALAWSEAGWPWDTYRAVVMTAVRAGVPVLGGNLPRRAMGAAMAEIGLDTLLAPAALEQVQRAVDEGHCGLLPPAQLPGMVRIQIARDQRLAEVIERTRVLGVNGVSRTSALATTDPVIALHAGEQHVARDRGVPVHLLRLGWPASQVRVLAFSDSDLLVDERRPAERTASIDHCAGLREQLARPRTQLAAPASGTGSAAGSAP